MTAETSRYRQLYPFRRTLQESSVLAELREFLTSSPGKLVSSALVLCLMCLFAGWFTANGQLERTGVLRSNLSDFEPRANASQVLYSSLSTANASANASFISTGKTNDELRADYLAAIATAGRAVVTSATSLPADERSAHASLNTIATYLPVYTGLVETARSNNRQDDSVGAAYLASASTLMQQQLLPAAESFYHQENESLRTSHDRFADPPWAVYGALLITALCILVAQRHLARRTRRNLNLGLLVAAAATTVALLWVVIAGLTSVSFSARAESKGADAIDSLTLARTLTQKARSTETMALVQRSAGAAAPSASFEQSLDAARASLAKVGRSDPAVTVDVDAARAAAGRWAAAHRTITERETLGDYGGATALAIGDGPDSAALAYQSLDDHLTHAIERARTLYRDNVNTARAAIAFSGPSAFTLCGAAIIGIALGYYPRIREYR
ncbi:hypothetical protein P0W64_03205 [Tsukamurella sp. 8F]|uniref:hypothetical protein n=1 Tax=unclassified Tsukamurella TaxID=2633480 RepID=UPI0023B985AF|nr:MULTISPECIES: hypothetical protein [unclassified Tsukamurella]MDF0529534.1 hypothetical protein [Tsukamurella sp. 8J]MDF0585778.1 hypothetical protein [Tsukamurella sp. 8F]